MAARPDRMLTRNQRIVLDCLKDAGRPLTAYQLLDRLRGEGIAAPPTVYRALERLVALSHVHRLESLNAYIACCAHGHAAEVVFIICDDCGKVKEIEAETALALLRDEAAGDGFQVEKTHVELIGRCGECRRSA